ncbi:MAG: DsbA family protein [Stellaceae bacterium]
MRLFALALAMILAGTAVTARAGDDTFSPAQKKAVEHIIRTYLVQHPEVLMDALNAARAKAKADTAHAAESAIQRDHAALYDDPDSEIGGNPRGDVTLIEFFDYRCPYCKEMQPSLEHLIETNHHLRIIYKEFPILGPASIYAAKMALAARPQGKYLAFHRAMMDTKGTITDAVVRHVAASVGIDVAKAETAMTSPAIAAVINKDYGLADAIGVQGTPAFVLDGKLIPGTVDLDSLTQLIATARRDHAG